MAGRAWLGSGRAFSSWLLLAMASLGARGGGPAQAPPPAGEGAPVLSGCEVDYPPYCLVTTEGEADGFSVELMRAALKAVGREVTFETGTWADIKKDLVDGRIQALPLVGRTPEREALFDFTFPYLTMHGAIVVRDDNADIRGPRDLKGKQVAVLQGDNAEEYLRRAGLGAVILPLPSFAQALRELSAGRYDAVVVQKLLAYQLMQTNHLANLKIAGPPLRDFTQTFCFAVRKGDRSLLASLNEGLALVMADGTFRRLYAKWFNPLEAMGLTKSRIVIGGDMDFPPYEFLDKNGQPAGFCVDLTRAIARHLGLQVDIRLGSWNEVRRGLEGGDMDLVENMFYSAERAREYSFSPPSTVVQYVIAVRKGAPQPATMSDLAGKSILVMRGDIMDDLVQKMGYQAQTVKVTSQEDALRALASGRGDCALVARVPALYWIEKHGWGNLRVGDRPVLSPEACYAAMPGQSELLAQFSEGLAALKHTGEYRDIQKEWLSAYEPHVEVRTILAWAAAAVLPLLALLGGALLWSWSLKREVELRTRELTAEIAERKQAQESLQEAESRYRLLFEQSPEGIVILDPETLHPVEFNERAHRQLGYTREEFARLTLAGIEAKEGPEEARRHVQEVLRTGCDDFETVQRTKTGELRAVHVTAQAIQTPGRLMYHCIWRDVTERNRTEEMLARSRHLAAVGQLTTGLAHEVRNPLFALQANAAAVGQIAKEAPALAQHLQHIDEQVRRLATLMKDLLELGQPLSADDFVQCALGNLVHAALTEVEEEMPGSRARVEVKVPSNVTVRAVPGKLVQALFHLLENALQVTPERLRVEIGGEAREGSCALQVRDRGPGLPREVQPEKLFEPFWTSRPGRRGLGLALARHYVGAHGGAVTAANNDPPPGATFTVWLKVEES
jgi:PAS domain S-box-containing protein